ncbi:MAG: SpoIIE family protein phosphatase [Chitinispirillales bacterium]|nr:SpoIIE family protein phosphatase [Chitinispirillales bacterium]
MPESLRRKNICLFLEGIAGLYYSNMWPGAVDGAKEHGCNLICYAGGALRMSPQNPYEVQRNIIYNFIDKKKIDGLIVSGTLKNFISDREFALFMEQFQGFPIVTLIPALENIPSILIDNASGMRSLISHLTLDHGYRKFGFIGGPKGNLDADQRLELFRKYTLEYGLESSDELIVAGDFSRGGGYKAVRELLNKRCEFDALITANDETALGAIAALQENGIGVPEDVAVTGFDGIEEGELVTPPLTTIKQPIYEIGKSAVELLIAKIRGEEVPLRTVLSAPLVIRQSCGCFINPEHSIDKCKLPIDLSATDTNSLKKELTKALVCFVKQEMPVQPSDEDLQELASAFFDEVENGQTALFLPALNSIVRAAVFADDYVLQWQKILVIIRNFTHGFNGEKSEKADELLHEGYNLFSEAAVRVQAHKRLQEEQKAALMRSAGHSIANSFDIPNLSQAVSQVFPNIGIYDFYLSLYDKSTKEFLSSKPVFSLQRGKKSLSPDKFFPTNELIPGGIKSGADPFQMVVQPLYFKNEQLGIAVFKNGPRQGYIYEILSEHLSGALQGALLMKKVQEQALTLEQQNLQLQKLRQQEKAYLEAVKRELEMGRNIQASFLPEKMPDTPGWESCALFTPAREVSGDFYDAFLLNDGRAAFVIADVSGKDVAAALFMSLIRSLMRAFSEQTHRGEQSDPLNAIKMTNRYIVNHHHTGNSRFMYATMFFAVADLENGEITYINAGHNPPALLRSEGKIVRWLEPTGPAVGITEEIEFRKEKMELDHGEMLVLYTDGVIEAKNDKSEFFTKKRFTDLLEKPYSSAQEMVDRVRDALKEHGAAAVPYDDVTMMSILRK